MAEKTLVTGRRLERSGPLWVRALYWISGWSAAGVAVSTGTLWVLCLVLAARTLAPTHGTLPAVMFPWVVTAVTVLLVSVTALQVSVMAGLVTYTWRRNREMALLGGIAASLYLVFLVFAAYVRRAAMGDVAVAASAYTVSGEAVPFELAWRLFTWGHGNPYTVTHGLAIPLNVLFATMSILFGLVLLRGSRTAAAPGAMLLAGAAFGLAGVMAQGLMPGIFTWGTGIAAALAVVGYFLLAGLFLEVSVSGDAAARMARDGETGTG